MVMEKIKLFRKHVVYPENPCLSSSNMFPPDSSYGSWCKSPLKCNTTNKNKLSPHTEIIPFIHLKNENTKLELNIKTLDHQMRLYNKDVISPQTIISKITQKEAKNKLQQIIAAESEARQATKKPPDDGSCDGRTPFESPQSPVQSSSSRRYKFFKIPDIKTTFDPQGCLYISWLCAMTFFYSYNTWTIPFRATFPYQTAENTKYWLMADYFCDLMYLIDVLFIKPRLMYLHEGFWVDDAKLTKQNYKKKLQYKFDVISLLPLDIFYLLFGTSAVLLRFSRLFKLQTFWEFHQTMDKVLSSPYLVRVGKTLFYIFYLIHLNACAYYEMSRREGLGSNGWVYDGEGTAYIRCFYFATKTATSIGKNPKPENNGEFLFMTVAWLMGVFVFALLIGQIRDVIATATRAQSEYRKLIDSCARYMRRLNMPPSLQRRVSDWITFTWQTQRCFDESRILDSLPSNMKRDVCLSVHMSTLSKVQLFQNCEPAFLRDLVLQLRPVNFLPGDRVVRAGDVGNEMYIVKMGELLVMSPDERSVLATLREGSVFGEISLLGIDGMRKRTATVISRGYANLFSLSKTELESAVRWHPEAGRVLRSRADMLVARNAARAASHAHKKKRVEEHKKPKRSGSLASSGDVPKPKIPTIIFTEEP